MKTATLPPPIPSAGDRVTGRHILGASFVGVIESRRPHTLNQTETLFQIRFDAPTELAPGDVRERIVFTGIPPQFPGDSWQDGHGGRFTVIPPAR